MSASDAAAIRCLAEVTRVIADLDGPIGPELSETIMRSLGTVMRVGNRPMAMATLDHVLGLIETLKQDFTA